MLQEDIAGVSSPYTGRRNRRKGDVSKRAFIIGADIEGFSKLATDPEQTSILKQFNAVILRALRSACNDLGVPLEKVECELLPTGDGCYALLFYRDSTTMDVALRFAQYLSYFSIAGKLVTPDRTRLGIRVGVHDGHLTRVEDVRGNPNYIGGALNAAQRVMDFASASQILLGREAGETARTQAVKDLEECGELPDKHGRPHRLWNYMAQLSARRRCGVSDRPLAKFVAKVSGGGWHLLNDGGFAAAIQKADDRWAARLKEASTTEGFYLKLFIEEEIERLTEMLTAEEDTIRAGDYSNTVARCLALIKEWPIRDWPKGGMAEFKGVTTMPARLWLRQALRDSGDEGDKGLRSILDTQDWMCSSAPPRLKVDRLYIHRSDIAQEPIDEEAFEAFKEVHREMRSANFVSLSIGPEDADKWEDFVIFSLPRTNREPLEFVVTSQFYNRLGTIRYDGFEAFRSVYKAMEEYEISEIKCGAAAVDSYKQKWKDYMSRFENGKS